ncbi:MAG TPA: trypsin-like serine protease [Candidatus Limnocylindrales bacterium]
MRRHLVALGAALTLLVAVAAPVGAITGNYRPDNEHGFVGLIAFYNSDWVFQQRCTGELLSPTVVLTAGHCVDNQHQGVQAHARIWILQDVGSHYDPNTQHDNVTGYPDSCTGTLGDGIADGWCAESDTMFNYGFDNFAGFPNIHDIGIVILDHPVALDEYASLAGANTVDFLQTARGQISTDLRVSGYGLSYRLITPPRGPNTGGGQNVTVSFRVRLQADEDFVGLNGQYADGFSIKTEGNGNDKGGTCNGDSGGPMFWPADSNQIVAVTSWGVNNAGCRGVGYYYRTDRGDVLDWIHETVGDTLWSQITVN